MSAPRIEKSFCTTREAASLLGVSVGSVQLWVESGLLQAWKTAGGHRRVLRESVMRLLHRTHPHVPGVGRPASAGPAARLRVMVVEDEPTQLKLYQLALADWAMAREVHMLDNGFAALVQMGRSCPDLLIADLHMEGIDGFAMLWALQKMPEAAGMRTVVVTGLGADEIAARGGLPGGVEVLSKPVPFERLRAIAQEEAALRGQPRRQARPV